MSYRIAVCDDEKIYIEKIRAALPDLETDNYTNPKALLDDINGGKTYDVLFIDIMMPDIDGLSLAREIREVDNDVIIVFITSKLEFIQTGYEVRAFRYLLKNQLAEGLARIWRDIEKELAEKKDEFFTYEFERQTCRKSCREIIYFESNMRRVILHTKSGTGILYSKLDDIEAAHPAFIRIHKSFLINRRHIRSVTAGIVITSNGDVLPISRKYAPNLETLK